ncbi:hypothetical protein HW555_000502 [Spodoptera exigua]|uniref:Alpha-N-acetylglucosaminidase n=1 Tax=Spodoptera exigua TaxID=7107 RepID=A0A835GW00_SPOEX|nr:hypothetical protein HW555_000502 [Spodoptera exigua]
MWLSSLLIVLLVFLVPFPVSLLNLEYLDPTKLQTVVPAHVQKRAALHIIRRYSKKVYVEIDHLWFYNLRDSFNIKTTDGFLIIKASTGVAAVWAFNYYLKKYCKSQIEWQTQNINIPSVLPFADETVIANDRFRYYQNACTVSYSFVWWNINDWKKHIEWMALNGINLTLAPVAQEAIWARIYSKLGIPKKEIDKHFTGPAFLTWLRGGNIHGWGGPLPTSWHKLQSQIQLIVIDTFLNLGIVPILPAFNGHVPVAFSRLYPNETFYTVKPWSNFGFDYCCGLFVNPLSHMFTKLGIMFLEEMGGIPGCHLYTSNPFNDVILSDFNTELAVNTAEAIFTTLTEFDPRAVWVVQNSMFDNKWPNQRVEAFLDVVPNGRILILDLQSERLPKYYILNMYYGQPFIWCMLHNFGGTLGMFGNMVTINKDVYEVRSQANSTMIGIGLTPEGINQNYVVYDLMLESAWRKSPVEDLNAWVADYAERRYGCKANEAWEFLLKSVYSYEGFGKIDGSYITTKKPSFNYSPWAWYNSTDLYQALNNLLFVNNSVCDSQGYRYDVVDLTRQLLQYKIEQIFLKLVNDLNTSKFQETVEMFLDAFDDMAMILATDSNFLATNWFQKARDLGNTTEEADLFEQNAWKQITTWGPNGQRNDYACKQWSEMVAFYYRPGWAKFLYDTIKARNRNRESTKQPAKVKLRPVYNTKNVLLRGKRQKSPYGMAQRLYYKWRSIPGLQDLRVFTAVNTVEPKTAKGGDYYEADYVMDN